MRKLVRDDRRWFGSVERYERRRETADDLATLAVGVVIFAAMALAWVFLPEVPR